MTGRRLSIPPRLAANCRGDPGRQAWLERLPLLVRELCERWSLRVSAPFAGVEGGAAWVAPARRTDGERVVLKLAMPHMEGEHEIAGLRFWDGDGTVRLLAAEERHGAMLLERCLPGSPLRALPETQQDIVVAGLARRLWRPPPPAPFRPLAVMADAWAEMAERRRGSEAWTGDQALLAEALRLLRELPRTAERSVLLATDLHAGNVLSADREPWLAIDPKPFVGDPAYDATQHLLNTTERLRADPGGVVRRFAELLGVEAERVRLWTFVRLAIGGRGDDPAGAADLARRLAP